MDTPPSARGQALELPISLAVLLVLVTYTYGILAAAPYSGFYFNPSSGRIETVYAEGETLLREGDIIQRVGGVTLEQYKADRRLVLFKGVQKGDVVEIAVERNGEQVIVPWVFPAYTPREFAGRLFNPWLVAYAFWAAGFASQLSIRPRNAQRSLFIAANFLVAFILIAGTLSSWHLWESSTLLHAAAWLMAPVFLHLHWTVPRPLGAVPKHFWGFLYGVASLLAVAELFHLLERKLYASGFAAAVGGSAILLIAHAIAQKEERRTVLLLFLSILAAFSLSMVSAVAVAFGAVFNPGWAAVFSMPFMPLAYFYLIYRRQLGGLEARVNRLVSLYAFLILLGAAVVIVVLPFMQKPHPSEAWAFITSILAFAVGVVVAFALPPFRAFIDQRLFGIKLPYQHLPETFSTRIAASAPLPGLLDLLEKEVFPSLLVRQYALLKRVDTRLSLLLSRDVPDDSFNLDDLAAKAGKYIPAEAPQADWMRLILPLKVGDSILGFWLLGKRDPDNFYSQAEIPILQSLADQTAVALSNLLQEEQLRSLYQTDVERTERERKSLARDLHDIVLNLLASMRNRLGESLPPGFLSDYEALTQRVREIIANLRPPMFDQGLPFALTGLADDIREKNSNLEVVLNVQSDDGKIPENAETHIFFIVREACQNAARHARAKTLTISGVVSPRRVDLSIQDDGVGFPFETDPDLHALLSGRHFGLAGMMERATSIGARMSIHTRKGGGATIRIVWEPQA